MFAIKVPAKMGHQWVREGFALFRKAPAAIGSLTFLYLLVLLFSSVVPVIGVFAPLLLTPALTMGMIDAARQVDQGQSGAKISPLHLFFVFRIPRVVRALLIVGLINAGITVLAIAVASIADGGALFEFSTGQLKTDDPKANSETMLLGFGLFLLVYVPAQMLLWYAPLLVTWHGISPFKALFFSWVAVWRNKWAFFNYAMGWVFIVIAAALVLQVVVRLVGGGPLSTLLLMPLSVLILCTVYCSLWPTFRDVFKQQSPMPEVVANPAA
jgi:hypothetical protein